MNLQESEGMKAWLGVVACQAEAVGAHTAQCLVVVGLGCVMWLGAGLWPEASAAVTCRRGQSMLLWAHAE